MCELKRDGKGQHTLKGPTASQVISGFASTSSPFDDSGGSGPQRVLAALGIDLDERGSWVLLAALGSMLGVSFLLICVWVGYCRARREIGRLRLIEQAQGNAKALDKHLLASQVKSSHHAALGCVHLCPEDLT